MTHELANQIAAAFQEADHALDKLSKLDLTDTNASIDTLNEVAQVLLKSALVYRNGARKLEHERDHG